MSRGGEKRESPNSDNDGQVGKEGKNRVPKAKFLLQWNSTVESDT